MLTVMCCRLPSSDNPYKGDTTSPSIESAAPSDAALPAAPAPTQSASASSAGKTPKPPGKRDGMKGAWRGQPIGATVQIGHSLPACAHCGAERTGVDLARRCAGAHHALEFERTPGQLCVRAEKHSCEADGALRHAVMFHRIAYGARTGEGNPFYAAGLTMIKTCQWRGIDPWAYAGDLIAKAQNGSPAPVISKAA